MSMIIALAAMLASLVLSVTSVEHTASAGNESEWAGDPGQQQPLELHVDLHPLVFEQDPVVLIILMIVNKGDEPATLRGPDGVPHIVFEHDKSTRSRLRSRTLSVTFNKNYELTVPANSAVCFPYLCYPAPTDFKSPYDELVSGMPSGSMPHFDPAKRASRLWHRPWWREPWHSRGIDQDALIRLDQDDLNKMRRMLVSQCSYAELYTDKAYRVNISLGPPAKRGPGRVYEAMSSKRLLISADGVHVITDE